MKASRITAFLLALFISLSYFCTINAEPTTVTSNPEQNNTEEQVEKETFPEPRAAAAILYDLNGGRILYESNSTEKNYPASITKIMTALLALEKGNLSDTVTVSESALADITYQHSRLGLKPGEEITLENLLISLLVCSANDSANVIAEYISGDIPSFVALMNERAAALGMTGTNFVNPHGFHDDNHYSTAADIAVLSREAIKNPTFCEIVKIKTATIPASNTSSERKISSTNHLISKYRNTSHYYQYATGLKTGSTVEAKNCLVATAEKSGISLLSVVLGCDNQNDKELAYSFVDTKAMFEYIFNNYKKLTIATKTDIISDSKVFEAKNSTRVALSPSSDIIVLLPKDYDKSMMQTDIKLPENISAPIEKGVNLGTATYIFNSDDNKIATQNITVDLLAANAVSRDGLLHFFNTIGGFFSHPLVIIPIILIVAVLFFNAYTNNKRKQQRRRRMKSHSPTYRKEQASSARAQKTRTHNSRARTSSKYQQQNRTGSSSGYRTTNTPHSSDPWDKYR